MGNYWQSKTWGFTKFDISWKEEDTMFLGIFFIKGEKMFFWYYNKRGGKMFFGIFGKEGGKTTEESQHDYYYVYIFSCISFT